MTEHDSRVRQHLDSFDALDFTAWNQPDWELFRALHTDDVIVEMMGQRTIGIEAHLEMCQAYIAATTDYAIKSHPIQFGSGDWTCGTGQLAGGYQMCTVARWRDGKICEEYIFQGGVPDTPIE